MISFQELEYFLRLCEEKSFSSASQKLFITQQGLSKAIKNLEEELTFPLFVRGRKGLTLTRYGEELYRYARQIQALRNQMETCIERMRIESRRVRVGTTMGVTLSLRPTALDEIRRALAPYTLEIIETTDFSCEDDVENGKLDFGVTIAPIDDYRFLSFPLKRQRMYALIRNDHPLSALELMDFESLKGERFILANQQFKCYYQFIECCRRYGFEPDIAGTTMETMMIYTKCLQNGWIGITADMPNSSLEYPGVTLVPFDLEEFCWEARLIVPRKKVLSKFEESVRDTLLRLMK